MDAVGSVLVCFFVVVIGTCVVDVVIVIIIEYQFGLVGDGVVLVLVPEMEQFDLIQGPIVSNYRINVGTDAVAAGIAVLVFKGITIVVTNNVIFIIIIVIIISGFDEKDIKRRVWRF
jgi:hypothetical protein